MTDRPSTASTPSPTRCGEPLTDFVIDAGTCQRPKGHWGVHWFNDKADRPASTGAAPEPYRDAASIVRQLSNALMWCDTRYRQTLEGKPVRDVTELRHEVVTALDASGRFLESIGSARLRGTEGSHR